MGQQGMLYTNVIRPYSTDFRGVPAGSKACRVGEYHLKEPVSGAGMTADWTSRVIQEAARESGITNLYYADLKTFRILDGIYQKRTLILYGD